MNALIVYDSKFGNTEKIAEAIAEKLNSYGQAKTVLANKADPQELGDTDILIIGSPTQAWRPTIPIQSFIKNIPEETLNKIHVAGFDTRFKKTRLLTGSAARIITKRLEKKGADIIIPPESFFVSGMEGPLIEGEEKRASEWAKTIAESNRK
ncbi:MAG: flavodoxin family protein [Candidatus Aenigmarchaeota archaeon]|nr:flavodoxin family protein [Candidatus Aenigmarchaeota archaeon]MCK5063392.1 flavodoxin family protein [Candidatus Aenigmarchaeota archaeon]MCK5235024.1 flavodoxin family protein [Candidatus Aenigmarchaeota archaeon]MCK5289866.1 flavodoxin family protein [Candidatus Aenigmarchaeota archaeon]MCK5372916.1 flavodoxin family protein [Candidatus Aenigmarchaeota archaeon]